MIEPQPAPLVDRDAIRSLFPALQGADVFLDNAGGSQVPETVVNRIRDYLLCSYAQLGADYETSKRATETVAQAHRFLKAFMNADGVGEVVIGPSTSALCSMLADCLARSFDPQRDEIIVCELGHEANIGPWRRLEGSYTIRTWKLDRESGTLRMPDLESLLSSRTRLVAIPHVSNLLGRIEDIETVTHLVHGNGARVVVDGVAFAPHRAMDVTAWKADWYVFSTYKAYGPHQAALFGTHEAFAELEGPNHFFIPPYEVPYKFELGGVNHEACAGILGIWDYLCQLTGQEPPKDFERNVVTKAFEVMTSCEAPLQEALLSYLAKKPQVKILGPQSADPATRVSTISFVHESKPSKAIAQSANRHHLGIRYGHFYAWSLCEALGLDPEDGVVRVSLVHYNDLQEVERLIDCFEHIL
ncbi:MAG: cysteine desulfurase-like protein [Planctomycetota bacterium]